MMHNTCMFPYISLEPEGSARRFIGFSFLAFLQIGKIRRCDSQVKKA